jgi:hypothetical protein
MKGGYVMTDNNISPEAQNMIDLMEAAFAQARERLIVSEQRASIAENQLANHQRNQQAQVRSAYQSGQASMIGTNEGNPEGGTKLVLNVN